MFFGKKKEKCHTLDRGLLAEAISIYSKKISLNRIDWGKFESINDVISLDDVLDIKILYVDHHWGNYAHCYSMGVETYVEGIKMASYRFRLDVRYDKELYRRWECTKKEIIHYMPNQFIDLMNDWSKQVVSEFDAKRNAQKNEQECSKKKKYDNEESILSKYR